MIFSKYLDIVLLKFPIYLPITYFLFLFYFPEYEYFLIFTTLIILAEPHFGATWPLLFNKVNFTKFSNDKYFYIILPIMITFLAIYLYVYFYDLFLLIFFGFNVYHVTRQSFGINKLFLKNNSEILNHKISIYFFGFLFLLIGILRFNLELINYEYVSQITILIALMIIAYLLVYLIIFKNIENSLSLMTGILIFYPICFVSKPIHGIIMGVTMHYIQYISLTYKITLKRKLSEPNNVYSIIKNNIYFIFFICLYGIIMTLLSLNNLKQNEIFKILIFIPILGQLLHFYYDSLIWKFSDKHNRNVTLKYIKSN